jgi:ketosteroid isomerase-like protein
MSDPISPPVARRPEEVLELVSLALSDGDLEAALAQYEDGAVLQPWADGTQAGGDRLRGTWTGGGDVRGTLTWFMALRLPLSASVRAVLPSANGLALVLVEREITGLGPGSERVRLTGLGTSMVRRQHDGTWRIVAEAWFLAAPAGPGVASPLL